VILVYLNQGYENDHQKRMKTFLKHEITWVGQNFQIVVISLHLILYCQSCSAVYIPRQPQSDWAHGTFYNWLYTDNCQQKQQLVYTTAHYGCVLKSVTTHKHSSDEWWSVRIMLSFLPRQWLKWGLTYRSLSKNIRLCRTIPSSYVSLIEYKMLIPGEATVWWKEDVQVLIFQEKRMENVI
jgi:hypothetical protein